MGAYEMVKDVLSLAQKLDNFELLRKLSELQTQIVDLTDENRRLREQITTREDLEFRENAYWRKSGDGPFCSKCWDADSKTIRMLKRGGYLPKCPNCQTVAPNPKDKSLPFEVL